MSDLRQSRSVDPIGTEQQQQQQNDQPYQQQLGQSKSTPNIKKATGNPWKEVDHDLPETVPIGTPPIDIKCGPLVRYWGMNDKRADSWRGSIMIVTNDSTSDYSTVPYLTANIEELISVNVGNVGGETIGPDGQPIISGNQPGGVVSGQPVIPPIATDGNGFVQDAVNGVSDGYANNGYGNATTGDGYDVNANNINTSSNSNPITPLNLNSIQLYKEYGVTFWRFDLDLNLTDYEQKITYSINQHISHDSPSFFIPAKHQDMNIMFYSCNGFSLGVSPSKFTGQLWSDVLQQHENKNHFHVMLGGGDQLYCDKVKIACDCIAEWSKEKNPLKKRSLPFTEENKKELDQFYLWHYISWFGLGYFNGPHGRTIQYGWPRALARIPMINIFDDHDIIDGFGSYTDGIMRSPYFVGIGRSAFKYYLLFQQCVSPQENTSTEPSWLLSSYPGPYIGELSRSVYARLGPSIGFFGLDCRTERSHHTVVSESTYKLMFDRLHYEVSNSNGQLKHIIVMLGVPIAYPRMVWLERILTSDLLAPIKLLTRRGFFSGLSNEFDDGIEILDDLDDHWCARHHKKERNQFVIQLQKFAFNSNVRVTILGGDVHLAGIGRFYSRKSTPPEKDYRHMLNVISSAIVNTPPPDKLADFLNKRSKVHHLGSDTDEDMVKLFGVDVDGTPRNNERLLPRRNWCSIIPTKGSGADTRAGQVKDGEAISNHQEMVYKDIPGSLSVTLHMEKDQKDVNNITVPYEVIVPPLVK